VKYEFLEILPNLKPGVVVHVHDIFSTRRVSSKTGVGASPLFSPSNISLQAFLAFNYSFEVLWGRQLYAPDTSGANLKTLFLRTTPAIVLAGKFSG